MIASVTTSVPGFSVDRRGVQRLSFLLVGSLGFLQAVAAPASAQRQMENLTRGVVAVRTAENEVYVGWRLFATDPKSIEFNLYRQTVRGLPVRLNASPLSGATNYVDRGVNADQMPEYFVRPVLNGKELAAFISRQSTSQISGDLCQIRFAGANPGANPGANGRRRHRKLIVRLTCV